MSAAGARHHGSRSRATTARDGFRVLGVAIRREPGVFAVSTVGAVVFGALTVADAWVLGWATEHVVLPAFDTGVAATGALVTAAALFVGVAIVRGVSIVARRWGAGLMQYRMQAHDRREVTRQYLRLPLAWHQRHPTGQLLSNANSDVEAAWAPIAPLPMAVGTVAMMAIAVLQMLLTDLVLAAVGMLVFPLVVLSNLVFQRFQSPLVTRQQALRAELSEIAHESFDGALVVKSLGREGEETARFAAKARALRDTSVRAGEVRAVFDPVMEALPSLGVLAVLLAGVLRVEGGATSPGDVVTIAYLLTVVAFPIRSLGWLLGEFPRSVVGFERVRAVLRETGEMRYGTATLPAGSGGVRVVVRGLGFAYDGQPVLDDVTFTVEPGRTVAIVGATASGKSTLTTLLFRLVDADRGSVELDGRDVADLARGALAAHAALVPQQAFLFDDSVRGNVALGADLADEAVWAALRTAQADGFVAALPDGLDTRIGERGTTLSGGQRQRLSLARAVVRRPRLLVMDDATSAVDPDVEARILAALRSDRTGPGAATVIVVAYRKATIALADEVVYLAGGRVADHGTHADLLARNPAYADLVNAYENAEETLDDVRDPAGAKDATR